MRPAIDACATIQLCEIAATLCRAILESPLFQQPADSSLAPNCPAVQQRINEQLLQFKAAASEVRSETLNTVSGMACMIISSAPWQLLFQTQNPSLGMQHAHCCLTHSESAPCLLRQVLAEVQRRTADSMNRAADNFERYEAATNLNVPPELYVQQVRQDMQQHLQQGGQRQQQQAKAAGRQAVLAAGWAKAPTASGPAQAHQGPSCTCLPAHGPTVCSPAVLARLLPACPAMLCRAPATEMRCAVLCRCTVPLVFAVCCCCCSPSPHCRTLLTQSRRHSWMGSWQSCGSRCSRCAQRVVVPRLIVPPVLSPVPEREGYDCERVGWCHSGS